MNNRLYVCMYLSGVCECGGEDEGEGWIIKGG